jgi:hypothetical protein
MERIVRIALLPLVNHFRGTDAQDAVDALEQRRNCAKLHDGFLRQITSVSLKLGGGVWLQQNYWQFKQLRRVSRIDRHRQYFDIRSGQALSFRMT